VRRQQAVSTLAAFAETALANRVVLVTGAAGRYGQAIAHALGRAGATVAMSDVDASALDAARGALADAGTTPASALVADLVDAVQVERLVDDVASAHGRLDALVHCPAILGGVPVLEYELDAIDRMLTVNLRAALLCSQRCARMMSACGGGSIVLIGSVGSARAHPSAVVYDACKGALDAGARAMAVDLAPHGVRVNVLSPPAPADGWRTVAELFEGDLALGADGILKRDLANAAIFLVSDASVRVTGQVLFVDNGLTATLRWPSGGLVG
jgi:NAD(P)-dependent dehydrogenase (short-subunit alcohol dehydrogenase family)